MRPTYYGLGDGEAWAVMSRVDCDENPPILIFESADVAYKYRDTVDAHGKWQVLSIETDELEYHAEQSGDRIMHCTDVGDDEIRKCELSFAQLRERASLAN